MKVVGNSLKLHRGSKRKTVGNKLSLYTAHHRIEILNCQEPASQWGTRLRLGEAVYFQTKTSSFVPQYCSFIVYDLNTFV